MGRGENLVNKKINPRNRTHGAKLSHGTLKVAVVDATALDRGVTKVARDELELLAEVQGLLAVRLALVVDLGRRRAQAIKETVQRDRVLFVQFPRALEVPLDLACQNLHRACMDVCGLSAEAIFAREI